MTVVLYMKVKLGLYNGEPASHANQRASHASQHTRQPCIPASVCNHVVWRCFKIPKCRFLCELKYKIALGPIEEFKHQL